MSYRAILFCPDEKTARTVTQVLTELDFTVEPCNEPFAAVKKLTTEHFDAVVVDCENDQNASLLFKSARNSGSNQTSLSVAVVEGQSGVAKAFRIGANLVLTKPINVEQSKGTLRVARGLLRKTEAAKAPAAAPTISSQPAQAASAQNFQRPVAANPPAVMPSAFASAPSPASAPAASASASSLFELEAEPAPQLEPTDSALLESMPDPTASKPRSDASDPRQNAWQPISKPMAAALKHAAQATGKSESQASKAAESVSPSRPPVAVSGAGAAAAPAPARKPMPAQEVMPSLRADLDEAPEKSSDSGSKRIFLIAAVILIAAAGGYFGWRKFQSSHSAAPLQMPVFSEPNRSAAPPAALPSVGQPSAPVAASPRPDAGIVVSPLANAPETSSGLTSLASSASKKPAAIAASTAALSDTVTVISEAPETIVVKNETPKAASQAPAPQETAELAAPDLKVASESGGDAISGLVNAPAAVPHAAPQTLKVSQGVSQGLLVKKVPPVYPPQAKEMRIQGAVQIIAVISKEGNITDEKVVSGDEVLAHAAVDAVKQWKYKPYYLDGQPVAIQTQITVNFTLP